MRRGRKLTSAVASLYSLDLQQRQLAPDSPTGPTPGYRPSPSTYALPAATAALARHPPPRRRHFPRRRRRRRRRQGRILLATLDQRRGEGGLRL